VLSGDVRRRYEVTRWCIAALSTLEPPMTVLNLLVISRSPDTATVKMLTRWVATRLGQIDARLAEHAFMVDDTFSVADVLVVTMLRMLGGLDIVEKFANVTAYLARCEQRPAWQRVLDAYEDRLGVARGTARRTLAQRLIKP
jgi:glutathione S-transferase